MTVLSQHRHEKALSLEEIAAKTYIQLRLLRALEEHRLEILPEAVFVQGFIRKYADEIGLDGAVFAAMFMSNVPVASEQVSAPAAEDQPIGAPSSLVPGSLAPNSLHDKLPSDDLAEIQPVIATPPKSLTFSSRRRSSRSLVAAILPILAVSAGIVTLAIAIPKFRMASQQPALPSPTVAISPSLQPDPLPIPQPSELATPINVSVTLKGDSWMQVDVDGKQEFEGTLKAGTERSWSAKETLTMQIGNAGDVLMSVNGSEAKPVGQPGEVRKLTIKPTDDGSVLEQPSNSESALDNGNASATSSF